MKQLIAQQVQFILFMTISGMALMAGYDILRFLRWLVPRGNIMVALEDILYWSVASVPIFYLFLIYHDGIIRWYGVVAVFGGIILYEYAFSSPVRHKLGAVLDPWRKRLQRKIRHARAWSRGKRKKVVKRCQKIIAKRQKRVYNDKTSLHG